MKRTYSSSIENDFALIRETDSLFGSVDERFALGVTSSLIETNPAWEDNYVFLITQARKCRMFATRVSTADVAATLIGKRKIRKTAPPFYWRISPSSPPNSRQMSS